VQKLSKRLMLELGRSYRRQYDYRPYQIDLDGVVMNGPEPLDHLLEIRQIRARALQECVHWGEPHIFLLAPGVVSWVIAMVDGYTLHGGLIGGEVVSQYTRADPTETIQYLQALGLPLQAAAKYVEGLACWTQTRIREAIQSLDKTFYLMSGWKPLLLEENFSRALQQRQVARAIHERKKSGKAVFYPLEKERRLLSMLKMGDRKGAQKNLNDWLGAQFYQSPRLSLLRARAIELLGYLSRALIEEAPQLECLLEKNHRWVERLIEAGNFEALCLLMDQAIADFIETIQAREQERSNQKVATIIDFIQVNYRRKISLAMIAKAVGLSTFRTAHLVKEVTRKTVFQILQEVRIQKAQDLLKKTSMSCTEIAYEVGYSEQSYFIKHFKRCVGVTPTRYRRRT
jgi:two-component system response regulator YesN